MDEGLERCPMCGKSVARISSASELFADPKNVVSGFESYAVVCDSHKAGCGATGGFRHTKAEAIAAWNRRAPAQPEPAAPTPDTFMGEPVLTRWKPLNRDDSRLALHQSMHNRSFGNPSDDKLMLEWLWENGYALCKRVPDEAAPTPQQQALDRMVENAEELGLYDAPQPEPTKPEEELADPADIGLALGPFWPTSLLRPATTVQLHDDAALWQRRALEAEAMLQDLVRQVIKPTAQPEPAAPNVAALQFLTDVVTAAGLLEHGKTDKGLARRIADGAFGLRDKFAGHEAAPTVVEPVAWAGYDLDGMVEAFHRVIEAHANKNNPFHNPIDADAQMALRILRGLVPAMKAYAPTPPRAALTDECLSLLDTAMDSLKYHQEQTRPIHLTQVTIQAIQEFLEKHQIGGPK